MKSPRRAGLRDLLKLPVMAAFLALAAPPPCGAADATDMRIIHMRYEAVDPQQGGSFVIWMDRETIHNGLDPRLFPAAKYVDVTYLTPAVGSPPITVIEMLSINSSVPSFYHLAGSARFRVSGMRLTSTTLPQ